MGEAGREVRARGNEERQAQAHEARILRSGCLAEGMSYEDIVREYSDFPHDSIAEVLRFAAAVTDRNDVAA